MKLIGLALPIGLATGLAAWLLAGGLSIRAAALDPLQDRLRALKPPATQAVGLAGASSAPLLGRPLFALTTGPGAVREPSIRVDGVSVTRRRLAALVAIDERPPEWLQVGETREGVTLQSVSASGAVFDTALGPKTLELGQQSAASAPMASDVVAAVQDRPPPGVRSPPEPASAPVSR
ncbi:MAG: hypothetical protein U1C74_06105 [Phenylobacterium sp.]|nr:hypothetical protein [Phenylobacterium sp.]